MNSPAQDVRVILEAVSSIALEFGVDLFVGVMPETPDECVSVADTGGYEPSPGPYYFPTVQVLIRGAVGEYSSTSQLAYSVLSALHEYTGTPDSSSYYYAGIWATGDPVFLGTDEMNRPMFSLNFRLQRR